MVCGFYILLLLQKEKRGWMERGIIEEPTCQNLNVEVRNSLCISLSFCDHLRFFLIFLSLAK